MGAQRVSGWEVTDSKVIGQRKKGATEPMAVVEPAYKIGWGCRGSGEHKIGTSGLRVIAARSKANRNGAQAERC